MAAMGLAITADTGATTIDSEETFITGMDTEITTTIPDMAVIGIPITHLITGI